VFVLFVVVFCKNTGATHVILGGRKGSTRKKAQVVGAKTTGERPSGPQRQETKAPTAIKTQLGRV